jgi:hypothetical protein
MPGDRNAKPVHLVEIEVIDCTRLAIAHEDSPTDQLLLGGMQFPKNAYRPFRPGA